MAPSADVPQGSLRSAGNRAFYVESTPEGSANAGIVVGDQALLFVDTRVTPGYGRALRVLGESLASRAAAARKLVALTHYHGDHTFGAGAFEDALFMCTPRTRSALEARWEDQIRTFGELRPAQANELATARRPQPQLLTGDRLELDLGGVRAVLQAVGPAHTPGDLIVRVPDDDVVFVGDLVFNGHWPVLWDADVDGWLRALRSDRARGATVIPGHGPAGGPQLLDEMADCLELLVRHAEGEEPQDPARDPRFGGWLHPQRVEQAMRHLENVRA